MKTSPTRLGGYLFFFFAKCLSPGAFRFSFWFVHVFSKVRYVVCQIYSRRQGWARKSFGAPWFSVAPPWSGPSALVYLVENLLLLCQDGELEFERGSSERPSDVLIFSLASCSLLVRSNFSLYCSPRGDVGAFGGFLRIFQIGLWAGAGKRVSSFLLVW